MAGVDEFPSNCLSNTIILQDFGDVAYIVCTVTTPPTSNVESLPSEATLTRLKHTEAQFRSASILAALDPDSLQLFTFYKKVDVMKDQRTLLAKFGNIVRTNSCTIAYKAAIKAHELLRPENNKRYQLFVSAILASIEITALQNRKILSLGQRYHIVENNASHTVEECPIGKSWSLIRTDFQMLLSGHVRLTLALLKSPALITISDWHVQQKGVQKIDHNAIPAILAPFGHLAAYRGGWIGSAVDADNLSSDLTLASAERLKQWRYFLTAWAKHDSELPFCDDGDEIWIELQLPRLAEEEEPQGESGKSPAEPMNLFDFKQIFWPTGLCFTVPNAAPPSTPPSVGWDDPVKFIQDWITTATERLAEAGDNSSTVKSPGINDDALFEDDGPFDNTETFQSFGPPAFPASQTIYPTPPDVLMTHATPGMSSIDGLAMTPANPSRVGGEVPQTSSQELEMTDIDSMQAAAIGSGYYDEDLFEEMPDDSFGPTGAGDEPNWDFFDKPDVDMDHAEPEHTKVPTPVDRGKRLDSDSARTTAKPDQGDVAALSPAQNFGHAGGLSDKADPSNADRSAEDYVHIEPFPDFDTPDNVATSTGKTEKPLDSSWNILSKQRAAPRRSSIYDKLPSTSAQGLSHDSRYRTQGMFWFDTSRHSQSARRSGSLIGWNRRTPSSSSASEASISDTESSPRRNDPHHEASKVWTNYERVSSFEEKPVGETDQGGLREEVREIFDQLKTKSTTLALEKAFEGSKRSSAATKKDNLGFSLMMSQIFVDQYTQSTLLCSLHRDKSLGVDASLLANLTPKFSDLNSTAASANVAQIASTESSVSPRTVSGKLEKLPERQILLKRSDKPMVASTNIIPFWDTLGLQPQARAKDVTAFCIHHPGTGIADGCASFLDRVADAYASCGLGTHKIGKIPSLTDTGLLTWILGKDKLQSQFSNAVRLGEALAEHVRGTIVVYAVSDSADPISYLQCCMGFMICWQAYKKRLGARTEDLELVPQVVPLLFVASKEAIVVPSQWDYIRLAMEVYSRIPPSDPHISPGACDLPMTLSEANHSVRFSLEATPASPFSRDGMCIHLAYSYTDDQRWIVACWSDDTGRIALTMTYLLRAPTTERGKLTADICKNMWEISQELVKPQRSHWRLIVSRAGFYEVAEINEWVHLANSEAGTQKSFCTLQLLSIELNPTLQVSPPAAQSKSGQVQSSSQPYAYGTPVSTPQAITTSPEQLIPATPTPGGTSAMNASTPPEQGFDANIDGDLSLVDPTDESWVFMLPFGLNQSYNILDNFPAIASGYLMKRLGPKDEDGLVSLGFHLVHTTVPPAGRSPDQEQDVLEDVIRQNRGLVTLAVARGCIDKVNQCVPWHIHTAVAGAKGLSGLI